MKIGSVTLTNYRSWVKNRFSFSPNITVILGPNTAGKTNILESVYSLATGKSFRADAENEVIRWDEELSRIAGEIEDTKLELLVTKGAVGGKRTQTKKYLVNGVGRRAIDFVGKFHAVLFWPEDLDLVTDSPSIRRKYLDRVLVQTDREYRRNLYSYERGLRQRNRLLDAIAEGFAQRSQLLFWNQLLIKAGGYLTDKRAELIEYINASQFPVDDARNNPGMNSRQFHIEYDKSVISESRLEQYADAEIGAKATLVGPHRDDFVISKYQISNIKYQKDGGQYLDLGKYGSRGEQRLGVLWLKLAELAYIQEQINDQPVLLLDDVFSELDDRHRSVVLELIKNRQTIITSAENDVVDILKHSDVKFDIINV